MDASDIMYLTRPKLPRANKGKDIPYGDYGGNNNIAALVQMSES